MLGTQPGKRLEERQGQQHLASISLRGEQHNQTLQVPMRSLVWASGTRRVLSKPVRYRQGLSGLFKRRGGGRVAIVSTLSSRAILGVLRPGCGALQNKCHKCPCGLPCSEWGGREGPSCLSPLNCNSPIVNCAEDEPCVAFRSFPSASQPASPLCGGRKESE